MIVTISMEELHAAKEKLSPRELIVDVRTPEEFAAGHVPGARNIPHETIAMHAEALKKFEKVYVYCRSGGRVQFACNELSGLGLKNLVGVVSGGMPDWMAAGFPIER